MKVKVLSKEGLDVTKYFCKDAENFLENINHHSDIEYLGKECLTSNNKKGIIIGIEDSISDYYYIVYIPEEHKVRYELMNSSEFIKNIII